MNETEDFTFPAFVYYHGSKVDSHGLFKVASSDWLPGRYVLVSPKGMFLYNVRRESFTLLADYYEWEKATGLENVY